MKTLTLYVPGIMGSSLRTTASGGGNSIWDEEAYPSLSHLASNPAVFSPGAHLVAERVLREMRVTISGYRIKTIPLCNRLLEELKSLEEPPLDIFLEYPYDWRNSILVNARLLADWINSKLPFRCDGNGLQLEEAELKLKLVAHSMGGLICSVALAKGFIHPANVKRLILIGSPLLGAPSAFRAVYDYGYLPFMPLIEQWVNFKRNRIECRRAMVQAMKTLPSVHELWPPDADQFVRFDGYFWSHPFSSSNPPPSGFVASAREVHTCLASLQSILASNNVIYHLIYSYAKGSKPDTDDRLAALTHNYAGLNSYTQVERLLATTGDGTVPVNSAALGDRNDARRHPVIGITHASMPDNKEVVDLVKAFLG